MVMTFLSRFRLGLIFSAGSEGVVMTWVGVERRRGWVVVI